MKILAITDKGLEDISLKEGKELIDKKGRKGNSVVIFEGDGEEIGKLCYLGRSWERILRLIEGFSFEGLAELKKKISKLDLKNYLKGKSFRVRSKVMESEISTRDLERGIGEVIYEEYGNKVNLEEPEVPFFVYIYGKEAYFGLDMAGFDLGKRFYKIVPHAYSLKANLAYGLVRISGYEGGELVNVFAKSGEMAIEAALWLGGKEVHEEKKKDFYFLKFFDFDFKNTLEEKKGKVTAIDEERAIRSGEKNAQAVGMDKRIDFKKEKIDWLDVHFKKEKVDTIVGYVKREEEIKQLKELFYQANYVLDKEGTLLLALNKKIKFKEAEKEGFKLKEKKEIKHGQLIFYIYIFKKIE